MGSGSWSSQVYHAVATKGYETKSREEIFTQRGLHADMDLKQSKTHIRESRDSEEHPESFPIIIALDETGSMGSVPEKLIREHLPKLMDSVIDSIGIKDPQICFLGIGDHECDYYPFQIGQFESSTISINQCLSKINLEARGGGNGGESYLLAWIFAGKHTSIDSFEKRGNKGYLFTVGDEPTLCRINKKKLIELTGDDTYEKDYTWQEAYELACEKYHVFHIHIHHGRDAHGAAVQQQMSEILGDHLLICTPEEVVSTICSVIKPEDAIPVESVIENTAISEDSSPKPQYR